MRNINKHDIFSVLGAISGDENEKGFVHRFDAIEFGGRIWLVPVWLEALDGSHRKPERIIGLPDGMASVSSGEVARYTLRAPVPRHILDGNVTEESEFDVVEQPDIRIFSGIH